MIRRNRAIMEIESSGFSQKSFTTQSSNNSGKNGEGFEFGTAAEKAAVYDTASKVIEQMESEGLCHPSWFQDQDERDAKWSRYLTQLRQKILASGKYIKC